jgi:hypothetical protein
MDKDGPESGLKLNQSLSHRNNHSLNIKDLNIKEKVEGEKEKPQCKC